MGTNRIALVTGANQGMGKQLATELVSDGAAVFVGARNLVRGEAAAAEIGDGATALHLDVTDATSIAAAAQRIREDAGRLDLLINNAGASTIGTDIRDLAEFRADSKASTVPLEEVRAVWEVNVFGPLAVYQAMLPLLRASSDARIVNVTSALGSLATVADPASAYHWTFDPTYAASKAALNALTLTMMVELKPATSKSTSSRQGSRTPHWSTSRGRTRSRTHPVKWCGSPDSGRTGRPAPSPAGRAQSYRGDTPREWEAYALRNDLPSRRDPPSRHPSGPHPWSVGGRRDTTLNAFEPNRTRLHTGPEGVAAALERLPHRRPLSATTVDDYRPLRWPLTSHHGRRRHATADDRCGTPLLTSTNEHQTSPHAVTLVHWVRGSSP